MTRKLFRKALLAGLAAVLTVLATVFGVSYRRADPEALAHLYTFPGNGNTTHLHIDADITNGARPCDPVDDTATVAVGAKHKVGVCIEDYVPNSIDAFELYIRYTGDPDARPPTTLNFAQTLTGPAPMLNLNPDANDGDDPTGLSWAAAGTALAWATFGPWVRTPRRRTWLTRSSRATPTWATPTGTCRPAPACWLPSSLRPARRALTPSTSVPLTPPT